MANLIKRIINANIPYMPWLTGYLAMLFGAVITFVVQSSSVFTSTLTPLVGVGVISIERVYPLTLGSNIGTTTTSLLAALATDASKLQDTLQISLCHLFFNITGILLFYPVPFMRLPIPMAKFLGETTAKYRWFSIAYLISMFLILPAAVFGLSVAGEVALYCVLGPLIALAVFVAIVSVLQRKKPSFLPKFLRNWKFLPLCLRSLEPMDRLLSRLTCCGSCCQCCRGPEEVQSTPLDATREQRCDEPVDEKGITNKAFDTWRKRCTGSPKVSIDSIKRRPALVAPISNNKQQVQRPKSVLISRLDCLRFGGFIVQFVITVEVLSHYSLHARKCTLHLFSIKNNKLTVHSSCSMVFHYRTGLWGERLDGINADPLFPNLFTIGRWDIATKE